MKVVNARLVEVVEEGKNPHIKSENEFGVRVRIELELGDKKDKDAFTDMAKPNFILLIMRNGLGR